MFFVVRVGGLNGSSQGGEDRGGVGVLDRERGHQIGCLIARELRGRKFMKIVSLAPETL